MATLKTVRWTIESAASEFGIDRKTLTKRIKSHGIEPGSDNRFSTGDICAAVYSDLKIEEMELKREQKEFIRLKKLQLAKKLCVLETVQTVWHSALTDIRQKVSNWLIDDTLKQELIKELQDIPTDEYFPADAPTPEITEDDE